MQRRCFLRAGGCLVAALAADLALPSALTAAPMRELHGRGEANDKRYPIPAQDGVSIDRQSQLILVRDRGHLWAFSLACPHQGAAVKWVAKDNRFQCTKHDSRYQEDGEHISGRATRNLDRFALRRDADAVVVDLGKWFQSDKDPSGWASAEINLGA